MKNTVFPHKFWRPFLDCMPQLFFRPQYVWFAVHLKGHLTPLCYETLVVNWQNWLFTLFHQSRSVLSPNPIVIVGVFLCKNNLCRYGDSHEKLRWSRGCLIYIMGIHIQVIDHLYILKAPICTLETYKLMVASYELTHWGWVTHICASKLYHHWFR